MAYYYVRNDGTATGDGGRYASPKTATDNWATAFSATSEYYSSIEAAMGATTTPTAGDFIYVSDTHSESSTSHSYGLTANPPVAVVSVDNDNVGQYSAGASETASGASDVTINGNGARHVFYGLTWSIGDDWAMSFTNQVSILYSCSLTFTGSTDRFLINNDGNHFEAHDTTITWSSGTTSPCFLIYAGTKVLLNKCTFVATSNTLDDLFGDSTAGINGGLTVEMYGCDLDDITGYILGSFGAANTTDDACHVFMSGCSVAGMTAFTEETFTNPNQVFTAVNCDGTSADAEWQYYHKTWTGEVETVPDNVSGGIVRNSGGSTFDGGRNVSYKVTTDSTYCSKTNPFYFDVPAKFMALSAASTDTVQIYFAVQTQTLTDTEVWAEVLYPDGTNKNIWNRATNRNSDILAAGTAHTDDSGSSDWENNGVDLVSWNEYTMKVSTASDVGADSVPIIRIFVGVDTSSDPIYFDAVIDAVAT